ncbi:MAG: hypothetical protein V4684_18190 [Pseudomonadota bacterium]
MKSGIEQWAKTLRGRQPAPEIQAHVTGTAMDIEDFLRSRAGERITLPPDLPDEVVGLLHDLAGIHGIALEQHSAAAALAPTYGRVDFRTETPAVGEEVERPPGSAQAHDRVEVASAGPVEGGAQRLSRLFQQATSSNVHAAADALQQLMRVYGDPSQLAPHAPRPTAQESAAVRRQMGEQAIASFQAHGKNAPACIVYLAGRAAHAERDRLAVLRIEPRVQQALRSLEHQAHLALNDKLMAHKYMLEDSNLVDRGRVVADDELIAIGASFRNVQYAPLIDLGPPTSQQIGPAYDSLLLGLLIDLPAGRPAVIPIHNSAHYLTLFVIKGSDGVRAVLFDSMPQHEKGRAERMLKAALRDIGLPEVTTRQQSMQANTPNSCGVHFQMLALQIDSLIESHKALDPDPVTAQQVLDFIDMYVEQWASLSPEEQIAQVDMANMERFQAMTARAMRT